MALPDTKSRVTVEKWGGRIRRNFRTKKLFVGMRSKLNHNHIADVCGLDYKGRERFRFFTEVGAAFARIIRVETYE